MRYAVYDVITPTEPITIYNTKAEALEKVKELNAYLLENVYVVKPYTEEITVTFSPEETKAITELCTMIVPQLTKNGKTKQASIIASIQNKIKNN